MQHKKMRNCRDKMKGFILVLMYALCDLSNLYFMCGFSCVQKNTITCLIFIVW